MMKSVVKKFILIVITLNIISCAMFSSDDSKNSAILNPPPSSEIKDISELKKSEMTKFSENPNIGTFSDKKYRRSTRKTLEDESELHSNAGSLWNNEGQGAYLFTQNKSRREGDLLNIKLEGAGRSQIETKVGVIKKLLARIEFINKQNQERARALASAATAPGSESTTPSTSNETTATTAVSNPNANANANANISSSATSSSPSNLNKTTAALKPNTLNNEDGETAESDTPFAVETVPTRVVERLSDGNYRVKGAQGFMIGKREYKVIVTGYIRPEDFSEDAVSSNKLLDPQWDVVSLRRVE